MMKRILGAVLALTMMMSTAWGAMLFVSAQQVTVTVGSVAGQTGDIVEVPVSISANSHLVNADMHILYDAAKLELVKDYYTDEDGESSCYAISDTLFDGSWLYLGNEKTPGDFMLAVVTGNNAGLASGGEMFRLAFRILAADGETISLTFTADPISGNNGDGELGADGYPVDHAIAYEAIGGTVIVGTATSRH